MINMCKTVWRSRNKTRILLDSAFFVAPAPHETSNERGNQPGAA